MHLIRQHVYKLKLKNNVTFKFVSNIDSDYYKIKAY